MAIKLSELPVKENVTDRDLILITRDSGNVTESLTITLATLREAFAQTDFDAISVSKLNFKAFATPTDNQTIPDTSFRRGDMFVDLDYIYVCVTDNYIKRVALQEF